MAPKNPALAASCLICAASAGGLAIRHRNRVPDWGVRRPISSSAKFAAPRRLKLDMVQIPLARVGRLDDRTRISAPTAVTAGFDGRPLAIIGQPARRQAAVERNLA